MPDDLKAQFNAAKDKLKTLTKTPDSMVLLQIYALYKQVQEGNCHGERPGMLDFKGRAKYDAWKAMEGVSAEDAMQQYIELISELVSAETA